jgi:purine nucleosidase
MRRFVIDSDTASDDAVAIMMALAADTVSVDALTIVAGNVSLEQASINARYVAQLCNTQVPVYEGCDRPWLRKAATAEWFHGDDGMSNQYYPVPDYPVQPTHAVQVLIDLCRQAKHEIEIVTLGPLTNLATALSIEPRLADWVKHCFVMGGAAATLGNVTPAAEYNFWCDPEAAKRVLHSGMNLTLIGWELSCGASTLDDTEIEALRALGNDRARVAVDSNLMALQAVKKLQGQSGLALADPVAMAVALDSSIALEKSRHFVDIETESELTRGMSLVDRNNITGRDANATVCFSIDTKRWKNLLKDSLG